MGWLFISHLRGKKKPIQKYVYGLIGMLLKIETRLAFC